ncbi:MAG: SpoIIE family protein phosphatase [Candidatus Eremiobacterales bacterium]
MLATSLDLSQSLPAAADVAARRFEAVCLFETVEQPDLDRRSYIAGATSSERASIEAARAAGAGMPAPLEEVPGADWRAEDLTLLVSRAIKAGPHRVGALALVRASGSAGPEIDEALVEEFAARIAAAIDNAHRFMRERRVSRSFQRALLPETLPSGEHYTFYASYAPATDEADIGGDWYDAFDLPDGRTVLSIGDVAGHGLKAAVIVGEVRQTFRVAAMENRDPAAVLDMANRLLMLRPEPTMVTALFGIYDGKTFTYASAGHPPPVLGTVEGMAEQLPIAGIPLGVEPVEAQRSWTVTIPSGSLLVLYTDGLIECDRDVLGGERQVLDAVAHEAVRPSADPAAAIRERVLGPRQNRDDIAILALAVAEAPTEAIDLRFTAVPIASRLVRQSVSRFARTAGLADDQRFALNVAIGEAVNNVIEHGYLREPGTLSVRVVRDKRRIISTVEDSGVWRRARRDGRGHGLSIIRSLMDGVEVNMSQGGTTVKMVYDVDRHPSSSGASAG